MADNIFFDRQYLTSWADALREATETSEPLSFPDDFNNAIQRLANSSGYVLPDLNNPASENQILEGYEAIDENGAVKTGTIPTVAQATPSINVSNAGLITASATQTVGYVSAGTKSATKQLTTQSAKTVTPSTSEQTAVASGVYTTGAVKVAAMPSATQATPSISVSSNGLITASATQTAGYVTAGTKNATQQLTTKGATTITPSKSEQTAVAAGVYTTGIIKVAPYTPNNTALTATDNGTYTPTGYDGFSSVIVAIPSGDEVSY